MKTIKLKLIAFALSVFSIGALAQCPTITALNVTYGASGSITVTPVVSGSITSTTHYNWYAPSSMPMGSGVFHYSANGTYSVCLSVVDSSRSCYSNYCVGVNITSVSTSSLCNANFTYYTDSSCVTHFVNSSTGSSLTYNWLINGVSYSSINPNVSLPNGSYWVSLNTYSGGSYCDSVIKPVTVSCGSSTIAPCTASFSYYTDSSCVTHFTNTTPCTYSVASWNVDGTNYFSTPNLALSNGSHVVVLNASIVGSGVSTITQTIVVSCGSSTVAPCAASFSYYTDSSCVTHFTNTTACSTYSASWNIDGTYYYSTPNLALANGSHLVTLQLFIPGIGLSTATHTVIVSCGSSTVAPCTASFSYYTDSSCVTHFTNTTPCTYSVASWNVDGTNYFSTPNLALSNGSHVVVLNASIVGSGVSTITQTIVVSCGSSTVAPCAASFSYYTDSSCVTHFTNTTACSTYSASWNIDGTYYYSTPNLALANGSHLVTLQLFIPGIGLSTATHTVIVSCGSSTVAPCTASFSYYTDSSCVTHFTNTTPCTYSVASWNVDGTNYFSTPNLALSNGSHVVVLNASIVGSGVSTITQTIVVSCGSSTVAPCTASFAYYIDSSCVTHFYNTTPCTYSVSSWNVDGTNYFSAPSLSLSNGSHVVTLNASIVGSGVSSITQTIIIACGSSTVLPCHASYVYYTDSSCVTHFISTSTGGMYTAWRIDGLPYYASSFAIPLSNGIHNVVLNTGCDSLVGTINILCGSTSTVAVTGVKELSETETITLNAYPNPIDSYVTIEISSVAIIDFEYKLIDALGRDVLTGKIETEKVTLQTSDLAKGFYSLVVTNKKGNSIKTLKLIK